MPDDNTNPEETKERPHGHAGPCSKCVHAAALCLFSDFCSVQCGNPESYDYGYWTEHYMLCSNDPPEVSQCKWFKQTKTLVHHPNEIFRNRPPSVSPGYARAWKVSSDRIDAKRRGDWRGSDGQLHVPVPEDVSPLGLPEEEDSPLYRYYARIHNEEDSTDA